MAFPKKNDFWKKRIKHGRDMLFSTPEILMKQAYRYFQWCIDNPLWESVVSAGKIIEVPKMRAMTLEGMCIFLGIGVSTFNDYCRESNDRYKDFSEVTNKIKGIIKTQKFEGAAAGLLSANIIARDLGLKEKTENENTNETTVKVIVPDNETAEELKKLKD
jgi:hypothetical protein